MTVAIKRTLPGLPSVESGTAAGEMVAWELTRMKIRFRDLSTALLAAGFDPTVNRAMLPRNAFSRACKELADKKLIRKVAEDETGIRFQFTAERAEGDGLVYSREAILTLDKATGEVVADNPALAERAKMAIEEQLDLRTANDVTRIIHRLCETQANRDMDLVPIGKGGTFWVRPSGKAFIDKVEKLIDQLNGSMLRLEIPKPAPKTTGSRNIREAVAGKIGSLIRELNETVEDFTVDSQSRSLESAAEKAKLIFFKIESYTEYLEDESVRLKDELNASRQALRVKVREIVSGKTEA